MLEFLARPRVAQWTVAACAPGCMHGGFSRGCFWSVGGFKLAVLLVKDWGCCECAHKVG